MYIQNGAFLIMCVTLFQKNKSPPMAGWQLEKTIHDKMSAPQGGKKKQE